MGAELLADPEPLGIEFIYSGKIHLPSTKGKNVASTFAEHQLTL